MIRSCCLLRRYTSTTSLRTFSVTSISSDSVDSTNEKGKRKSIIQRIFGGKAKEDELVEENQTDMDVFQREDEQLQEAQRRERIRRLRNKSRLKYSDRCMLYGQPPLAGLVYEMNSTHRSLEYKRRLAQLYGFERTGIDPRVMLPNDDELEDLEEFKRVYYNGVMDENDRIELERQQQLEAERRITEREEQITKNFAKLDKEIKNWKARQEGKDKVADREKARRKKVLADLRAEYGYDIDPSNPIFADKFAEREKAYMKAERAERKAKDKERAQKRAEEKEQSEAKEQVKETT